MLLSKHLYFYLYQLFCMATMFKKIESKKALHFFFHFQKIAV